MEIRRATKQDMDGLNRLLFQVWRYTTRVVRICSKVA